MEMDIEKFKRKSKLSVGHKYLGEVAEGLARSQKTTEQITQTDEYVNWLENFTIENKAFSDDNWLYCPEKISKNDKDKLSKLSNFYDAIQIYANKNYIYSIPDEFGSHYNVKHNDIGYEIGIMVGQGILFWVRRQVLTEDNSDNFIDFKLIQENKITDRTEVIRGKLTELDNLIKLIASEDVPIEAIVDITEKGLRLIKEKRKS